MMKQLVVVPQTEKTLDQSSKNQDCLQTFRPSKVKIVGSKFAACWKNSFASDFHLYRATANGKHVHCTSQLMHEKDTSKEA